MSKLTSEQKILAKALTKARNGGWDETKLTSAIHGVMDWNNYRLYIFNHDFAKALWGDTYMEASFWFAETETMTSEARDNYPTFAETPKGSVLFSYDERSTWKHHLQNMVVADDPVAYLSKNI